MPGSPAQSSTADLPPAVSHSACWSSFNAKKGRVVLKTHSKEDPKGGAVGTEI